MIVESRALMHVIDVDAVIGGRRKFGAWDEKWPGSCRYAVPDPGGISILAPTTAMTVTAQSQTGQSRVGPAQRIDSKKQERKIGLSGRLNGVFLEAKPMR